MRKTKGDSLMIIDESTARAAIKKNIKVYNRRLETMNHQVRYGKKSRKGWLKKIREVIEKTSWVVDCVVDKQYIHYYALMPADDHFASKIFTLNSKTMHFDNCNLNFVFTNHFIARLMQYKKSVVLSDLTADMSWIMDILFSLNKFTSGNHHNSGNYRLYADKIGFIPAVFNKEDEQEIFIVKTLIPPSVMGEKHWSHYEPLIGTDGVSMERVEYH